MNIKKFLIGSAAGALMFGTLAVGAFACTSVDPERPGTYTAAYVATDGETIAGNINAAGCDIGIFVEKTVSDVTVNATVHDANQYGVFNDGNVTIDGANIYNTGNHDGSGNFAPNGVQTGLGVYFDYYSPSATGSVLNSNIHHYQKGGVVISGQNSSADVTNNMVTGLGPVPFIAQNGIQFGYGAKGTARGNTIDGGHEYTGDNWTSTGLLLFDVNAQDVKTSTNKFIDNQTNYALVENNACKHQYGGFYEDYGLCLY